MVHTANALFLGDAGRANERPVIQQECLPKPVMVRRFGKRFPTSFGECSMNPRHVRIGKAGYETLADMDMSAGRTALEKALTDVRDPERGWLRRGWGEVSGPGCLNTRLLGTMDATKLSVHGDLGARLFFEAHPAVKLLFERALHVNGGESDDVITRIISWNDSMDRTAQDIELLLINLIRICRKVERNQHTTFLARYQQSAEVGPEPQHVYVMRHD